MLIDNEKFVALLADNSGIEKEKVEGYLEELISEMKTSFDEGEGYEVEGFGIFSKLGSNILFIPSDELETEINYKYVGMEPIELPGGASQEEPEKTEEEEEKNPIQGILDGGETEESQEYEDPFAELFNEAEEQEKAEKENVEKGDLTEDEIEAVVEEEIESEGTEEVTPDETETEEEPEEALEDSLKDIFGSDELEEEPEPESVPGPEKWGIDAHKEEEQEGAFSGLLGDAEEEPELIDEDDIFVTEDEIASEEDVFEPEDEVSHEESVSEEETDEEVDFSALEDDTSDEDFDDPFDELIEEEEADAEDFVPVVTNVSSGKASKKEVEESEEEPEEKTEKKSRIPKSPRGRKQSSPVFLYMILALILLGGTGYLLAYFGVVNIEGITPSSTSTQVSQNTPPVTQPESTPPQTIQAEEEQPVREVPKVESNSENAPGETEETTGNSSDSEIPEEEILQNQENGIAPLVADEKAPGDGGIISPVDIQGEADVYGLNGTATEAGNNGYTIVLYTLSRKSGADAQFEKLSKEGFRVIIKEKPSKEFGALYRVSIGQFESLADAAIAAEKVDSEILGNYIITKI